MANGGIHIEPDGCGLFARDDEVDIVFAAQAMIGDGEERVGIGREIDTNDVWLLVGDVINESGVLMREAVVVLTPDMGGKQIVERRDGGAPGNVARDFQPFGVLVEHGIDNVDESFIAGEKAVAAGEEITFEPTLAHVFAEDFQDAAFGAEVLIHWLYISHPLFAGDFVETVKAV